MRPDLDGPVKEAAGAPFAVSAMMRGHVFGNGRMPAAALFRAGMQGDSLILIDAFNLRAGDADIYLARNERVRDAVVMAKDLDMVINMHARPLPFGELIGCGRQRLEGRFVERLKLRAASARQFFERAGVEIIEQAADRAIEIVERIKSQMAKARQNPTFDDLYGDLDFGFVTRLVRTRGQSDCRVMIEHLLIAAIERRFVAIGARDRALEIVRDDKLRDTLEELEGVDV